MKNMMVEECEFETCSGWNWKSSDECPNDRKFDPKHPACQECEKDAMEAMAEVNIERR